MSRSYRDGFFISASFKAYQGPEIFLFLLILNT